MTSTATTESRLPANWHSLVPPVAQPHARVLGDYLTLVSGDAGAARGAAHGWTGVAGGARSVVGTFQSAVAQTTAGWLGASGQALGSVGTAVRGGTDGQVTAMTRVGAALNGAAGDLHTAQRRMETVIARFVGGVQTAAAYAGSAPPGAGQQYLAGQTGRLGDAALRDAGAIKSDLDSRLSRTTAVLVASAANGGIPSSDGTPRHTYPLHDLRRYTTYSKKVSAVDDSNGHRAIVRAEFTKENGGRFLRIRGFSEGIKYEQDGRVPARIVSQDWITMDGERRNAVSGGLNGSIGADSGGFGVSGGTGWTSYTNGDALKMNVQDTHRNYVDISGKIEIPRHATELEYKKEVMFVYPDGSRVQRTVSFLVPL
jgi:hypothetical protein